MNNTILDNVILLSEDKTLNGEKFDKLAKKTCMLVERLDEDTYTMKDNIKRNLLVPITFATALKAIFQESYDIHRREKAASKVLGIDMKQITEDKTLLTHLNNFVHPYNSFSSIEASITDSGEIRDF